MTDQSLRETSGGKQGAGARCSNTGAAGNVTPPADPSAPLASGKPAGTRLGFSNYLGLAGALLAMIVLFSLLSSHFLTYDTFSTIANQIPGSGGDVGGDDLRADHRRDRSVGRVGAGAGRVGGRASRR